MQHVRLLTRTETRCWTDGGQIGEGTRNALRRTTRTDALEKGADRAEILSHDGIVLDAFDVETGDAQ